MHQHNELGKQYSELDFWVEVSQTEGLDPARATEKYCARLGLAVDQFRDLRLLDVGCGPNGALDGFEATLKIGLDVLARSYAPFAIAEQDMIYIAAPAEDMPFVDQFFDAVTSVTALDRVDDLEAALREIHRVTRTDGCCYLAFYLGHPPMLSAPRELTEPGIKALLEGRFAIERSWIETLPEAERKFAPRGVLVIHGKRLPGPPSPHAALTLDMIADHKRRAGLPEARHLRYALDHGAPRSVVADLSAALAFREHQTRTKGWGRRALRALLRAGSGRPAHLMDRGVWSLTLHAAAAALRRE